MDYNFNFKINDRNFNFDVKSKYFKRGKDICNYKPFKIYKNEELCENGYIIRTFPKDWKQKIKKSITNLISNLLDNPKNFKLEKYHKFVDDKKHADVVKNIQSGVLGIGGIPLDKLGINYLDFDDFINYNVDSDGLSCNDKRIFNLLSLKFFWIRIIRPNSIDNNPPHKDTHFKRIKNNVNIYLPLAGSNKNSSLPLIPKTHIENENQYIVASSPCYINGKIFRAPAIVHRNNGLNLITPNPQENQIMIFDPHIVHGGGVNSNKDMTRVSLEMRFYKNI
jgi:hypothetical protein